MPTAPDVEKENLKKRVAQLESDAARLREIQGQSAQDSQGLRTQLRDENTAEDQRDQEWFMLP